MKDYLMEIFSSELFSLMINASIIHTIFSAAIMATLQVPPDTILESGLREILMVFEE
ncbi:MAG: hypothetical protein OEY52_01775 [Gammaproteobacteria bacterium]|nr:hypothetical protein [Gammaproteobacteria bacterium]